MYPGQYQQQGNQREAVSSNYGYAGGRNRFVQQNSSNSYQQNRNVPFYTLPRSDNNNSNHQNYGNQASSTQYNAAFSTQNNNFNPSDGNNINHSRRDRNAGFQTWVKRDSLRRHTPYSGPKGMNMLQKMGWNPGQGLGRRQNGALEPHMPDIKMNKRGFDVNRTEIQVPVRVKQNQIGPQLTTMKLVTEGKHPSTLLEEYCSKKKIPPPRYEAIVDEGPIHAKKYVFKITVEGVDYPAEKSSHVKKEARAHAARECLVKLGILKGDPGEG